MLSLYGINFFGLSANEFITIPNTVNDLLIFAASLSLSPVAAVNFYLSLPAKSTKFNLLFLVYIPFVLYSSYNVKIEWLLELSKFI